MDLKIFGPKKWQVGAGLQSNRQTFRIGIKHMEDIRTQIGTKLSMIFFGPAFFRTPNFFTKIRLDANNFWPFLFTNIINTQIFFWPKISLDQNFLDPKYFWNKYFLTKNCLDPKFLDTRFYEPRIFWNQKMQNHNFNSNLILLDLKFAYLLMPKNSANLK